MKVCFVSHSAGLAGAERSLLELVEGLTKMQTVCSVILPYRGPLYRELLSRGIDVSILPFTWWVSSHSAVTSHRVRALFVSPSVGFRVIRTLLNLLIAPVMAAQIRRRHVEVVYTNTITVCAGALAAWILGLPHVWTVREFGWEDFGLTFDLGEEFSMQLIKRLSSIVLVNSQAVGSKFSAHFGLAKTRLVYGSVVVNAEEESGRVLPVPNGTEIRCIIVGLLRKAKGQEDAIRAMAELRRFGIQPVLWIVGAAVDAEYEKHLRFLVKDMGLQERVKFLGSMKNPFLAIRQADVVLVCSRSEAFGRVTAEGMLAGKPVIGTQVAGTLELIQEGFNGLLYTPGDCRQLAAKIARLHDNPTEAQKMGKNGYQWAQTRFSQVRFAKEVLAILNQVRRRTEDSTKTVW